MAQELAQEGSPQLSIPAGVLFFPVRAGKPPGSIHGPSALRAFPVIPTCRSCCWNWCNWNSLCWEGRAAPFQGAEVQLFPAATAAPGHLQEDTLPPGKGCPPEPLHGQGAALGAPALGTALGWQGRDCGAFREASESS